MPPPWPGTTVQCVADETTDQAPLTRTERRWLATHQELLDATLDELLGDDPKAISANSISRRADRAPGTFFNHFESVDDAINQALAPVVQLRDEGATLLSDTDDPAGVLPVVFGIVLARCVNGDRALLATAAARELGHALPGTGPLSEAVIEALGGVDSPNHVAYTTRLVAATIDHICTAFSRFQHPPTSADIHRAAWNLITTAVPPSPSVEELVAKAIAYAEEQIAA